MVFDLVVLGKDPAGLEVAFHAVEMGQRVGIVDDPQSFGRFDESEVSWQTAETVWNFSGATRFITAERIEVRGIQETHRIGARRFVVASGSRAKRPNHIGFDGRRVLDSDEIRNLRPPLQSWLIVGAGDHGLEAARQLTATGARVSIVDQCPPLSEPALSPNSRGVWDAMRDSKCPVHWGTTVLGAEPRNSSVTVYYNNGSIETYEGVVFAVGRVGCTDPLRVPRPDLLLDETQRIWCNPFGQTSLPHIYAVGSVVGFPRAVDSPRQEAARVIEHIFREEIPSPGRLKPRTGNLLIPKG